MMVGPNGSQLGKPWRRSWLYSPGYRRGVCAEVQVACRTWLFSASEQGLWTFLCSGSERPVNVRCTRTSAAAPPHSEPSFPARGGGVSTACAGRRPCKRMGRFGGFTGMDTGADAEILRACSRVCEYRGRGRVGRRAWEGRQQRAGCTSAWYLLYT